MYYYYHTFQSLSQAHFAYIHGGCSVKYSMHTFILLLFHVVHDYVALLHVFLACFILFVINLCLLMYVPDATCVL